MEQYVTIELFGQPYRFKADTETAEAQQAANYLMDEVEKVQHQHGETLSQGDRMTVLLSVALNIAHENLKLNKYQIDFKKQLSDQSAKILNLLEALP
ncbi:MAG: cell division protein ZapA [Desulfobacterales bacterium]